jgi:hypothetical protein
MCAPFLDDKFYLSENLEDMTSNIREGYINSLENMEVG